MAHCFRVSGFWEAFQGIFRFHRFVLHRVWICLVLAVLTVCNSKLGEDICNRASGEFPFRHAVESPEGFQQVRHMHRGKDACLVSFLLAEHLWASQALPNHALLNAVCVITRSLTPELTCKSCLCNAQPGKGYVSIPWSYCLSVVTWRWT